MLKFSDWSSLSPSQKVKVHGPRKVILAHFNDFGHFPIEIPIVVKKNYGQRKEWSYNENKKCSEIREQNGTT